LLHSFMRNETVFFLFFCENEHQKADKSITSGLQIFN